MKTPRAVGIGLGLQQWARLPRRLVTLGLVALGLNSASAQLATSTLATGLSSPNGVAVDPSGIAYVADAGSHVIRKIAFNGTTTTLAGQLGVSGSNNDGTTPANSTFNSPRGIAINSAGTVLYVADTNNHVIRQITLSGAGGTVTAVSTLAGTVGSPGASNTGVGTFSGPKGVAFDGTNVYVADTNNHLIRKIAPGPVVTTVAGLGTSGFVNGAVGVASFNSPEGVAVNGAGTILYVADTLNHAIRSILLSGPTVSTYAGTGTTGLGNNATGTLATFSFPRGIAVDGSDNLYIADSGNNAIRLVSITSPNAVSTVAGSGGSGAADGTGGSATFNAPNGIATKTVASVFLVYIADTGNNSMRKAGVAAAPTLSAPSNVSSAAGTTVQFTVTTVTGFPAPTLQWQRNPGGNTSFQNVSNVAPYSGATTNQLTISGITLGMQNDSFRLVASNSVAPGGINSSTATLAVTQAPTLTGATLNFIVNQVGTYTITASAGSAPISYTTTATPGGGFSLTSSTGFLSWQPGSVADSTSITITATNTQGSSAAVFNLVVLPSSSAPIINSQPQGQTVSNGAAVAFSVTATGNPSITGYQWYKNAGGVNSFQPLSNDGTYSGVTSPTLSINSATLSMQGDLFQVQVTNSIGTTTSNSALLAVSQLPSFNGVQTTLSFTVGVLGTYNIVASSGSPPINYTANNTPFNGNFQLTSGGLLTWTPTSTADATTIQINAQNTVGTVSQIYTLGVTAASIVPSISTQPSNSTVNVGANATFTSAATGSPTPTTRWQRQPSGTSGYVDLNDDGTYGGTSTATLTVTGVTAGMTGDQFRLLATNVNGSVTSNSVTLTVNIGTSISTFIGLAGSSGSLDGTGTAARLNNPSGIAIDTSGNIYIADSANNVIRKVTSGGVVTTLAGLAGSSGSIDAVGSAARFSAPQGVAVDGAGNVYVADTFNHTIRLISPGGSVTTLAGSAGNSGAVNDIGANARFSFPTGVAVDSTGTVYVADSSNHAIRRITTFDRNVTTFAGTLGSPNLFKYPSAIAFDTSGNLYVADTFNQVIRKVTQLSVVSVVAGIVGVAGGNDSIFPTAATFSQPQGIAVDSTGNIYVADTGNNTIRKIALTGEVTTLAGSPGAVGSVDGIGNSARFNSPFGVAVDATGNVYVSDTRNHTIRRTGTVFAPGITTQPQNQGVAPGQTATFTVVATGVPTPGYQWQKQLAGGSGFFNLGNDGINSGVTTATLSVSNVTATMNGDKFRVFITNGVAPGATSNEVLLTVGTPPAFTSANNATFRAGQTNTFTLTTDSSTSTVFTSSALPIWLGLNPNSGVLGGTPPDTTGSPLTLTLFANNGITGSQTFTLTILPANQPPTVTTNPTPAAVTQGGGATFTVAATGSDPLSYQWRRNGVPIGGATAATLSLSNIQAANAGTYSAVVTNPFGVQISNGASLVVTTTPTISSQPHAQVALPGGSVTFDVTATGGSTFTYQWRKNGVAILGATNSTLVISNVTSSDAGNYDVTITNAAGIVFSAAAQLTITPSPVAPVITAQPAGRTVVVGNSVSLSVAANGAPAPGYQWRKNGSAISGANSASYVISNAQSGDAANYDVVVTNSVGSVTSGAAVLRIINTSYGGTYFGTFAGSAGNFALYVRDDNTGVFLGYLPGSATSAVGLDFSVNDSGQFSFQQAATASAAQPAADEPSRAEAIAAVAVNGTIAAGGTVSGAISGGASATFSGARSSDFGGAQAVAGFYLAGAADSGTTVYTITNAAGQAFAVVLAGAVGDGGLGVVGSNGQIVVGTARGTVNEVVNASTGAVTGTVIVSGTTSTLRGASEAAAATQRLANISTRARVGTGETIAIAGFVISGTESKPVLIRAVGPTLGSTFGVAGVLATPKLDLFRGANVIATNTGWGTAANADAILAASVQAGAFALSSARTDSVIMTTLAPGGYTAQVSSANGTPGVALVEVYDLSAGAAGQKLINISTRASAGTGDNTLIAGVVVTGAVPKRVLIRAIGPGLAVFGVQGVLAQPVLQLISNGAVVAQNTRWSTSADASAITTYSAQVGGFALAAADSAVIATLAPGSYSAVVSGVAGGTGVALVEVYELP